MLPSAPAADVDRQLRSPSLVALVSFSQAPVADQGLIALGAASSCGLAWRRRQRRVVADDEGHHREQAAQASRAAQRRPGPQAAGAQDGELGLCASRAAA